MTFPMILLVENKDYNNISLEYAIKKKLAQIDNHMNGTNIPIHQYKIVEYDYVLGNTEKFLIVTGLFQK